MKKKNTENLENWATLLLGVLAIIAIKAIFEDDNSKIVSKKGRRFLSDEEKMKDINKKIQESEQENSPKDVFI